MDEITDAHAAYAEQLLHLSALIVGAVRDDEPTDVQEAIDRALILEPPPGVDPAVAVITLLAAQVDADSPASTRLGWITGDRILERLVRHPLLTEDPTIDQLDAKLTELIDLEADATESVLAVLRGERQLLEVPLAHRLLTVEYLARKGHSTRASAQMLRCNFKTVLRYRNRYAETAARSAA